MLDALCDLAEGFDRVRVDPVVLGRPLGLGGARIVALLHSLQLKELLAISEGRPGLLSIALLTAGGKPAP